MISSKISLRRNHKHSPSARNSVRLHQAEEEFQHNATTAKSTYESTLMPPLLIQPSTTTLEPSQNQGQSHLQCILTTLQPAVINLKQVCITSTFTQSLLHPTKSPTTSFHLPTQFS